MFNADTQLMEKWSPVLMENVRKSGQIKRPVQTEAGYENLSFD